MAPRKNARKNAKKNGKQNGNENESTGTVDKKGAVSDDQEAAARRTVAAQKPTEPGKPGEVKNGFRWDTGSNSWEDHRGIDFSKDKSQLPHNMQHVGDGSPEHPHRVEHVGRWS